MGLSHFLDTDFETLLGHQSYSYSKIFNKTILITGATGFFGSWIIFAIHHLNALHGAGIKLICLSRDPENFLQDYPEIRHFSFCRWIKGDLTEFIFDQSFDFVIYAAWDVPKVGLGPSFCLTNKSHVEMVTGLNNILNQSRLCDGNVRFLFLSSGAVYKSKKGNDLLSEDDDCISNSQAHGSGYSMSKLIAEKMCFDFQNENPFFHLSIARCFSFSGPMLPLNHRYALGNFIKTALSGESIVINGSGLDKRSYLYGAELPFWLFEILTKGKNGDIYNVGGTEAVSIKDLAELVSRNVNDNLTVTIKNPQSAYVNYLASLDKTSKELGLNSYFSIEYGIKRMLDFLKIKREV